MAQEGPSSPGSAFNDDDGATDWTDPGNVLSQDASLAVASLAASGVSEYLRSIGYGFSIPAGATVDGVLVEVYKSIAAPGGEIQDNSIRLIESGSYAGDDKATADAWLEAAGYVSYGGASDTWGVTWTTGPTGTINASGFGVGIKVHETGATFSQDAQIDHVRITVYYTAAAYSGVQTRVQRARRSAILRM